MLLLLLIIAELSGRHRQSPIVLGGEDQSLGTKDTLSIGPHWSHVFINSVRFIYLFIYLGLLVLCFVIKVANENVLKLYILVRGHWYLLMKSSSTWYLPVISWERLPIRSMDLFKIFLILFFNSTPKWMNGGISIFNLT